MEFHFGAMLCSNLGNKNSEAGRINCPHGPHLASGPQVPHPWSKINKSINYTGQQKNTLY